MADGYEDYMENSKFDEKNGHTSRKREEKRHRDRSRERKKKDKKRSRSRSKERRKSSPDRNRERHHKNRRKSRSRSKDKSRKIRSPRRSRSPKNSRRSPSPYSPKRSSRKYRSRSKSPKKIHKSKSKSPLPPTTFPRRRLELTPEERDMRTVFCMQLSQRVRTRDLEEFFAPCGRVNDVRIISDNKTKRSKGIAYIEFEEVDSVNVALGLNNKRLHGIPIVVQQTQAEKNRAAGAALGYYSRSGPGPMRLYIGSLHFNVTESMLRDIFEPFGTIESIELLKDGETGRSRGYGFLNFVDVEDAKRAMEHLNGFELAGRPMRVGHVTEKTEFIAPAHLDTDELDQTGIDLGATGRLQLMAKLAEGTGLEIPQATLNALHMSASANTMTPPPIATQCFMLSNMFDPYADKPYNWSTEIKNDVIDECRRHGGALHVFVDKASQGNVYVKCPTISAAVAAVGNLHGRWFAGRMVTAAYVPIINYHLQFQDAITAVTPL